MSFFTNETKGTIYAIASGFCFGLLGYLGVTLIKSDLSLYSMLFWRFAIGAGSIGLLIFPLYQHSISNAKECLKNCMYGIILYAPTAILYFFSCNYIGTGLAMVTFFTYPVMVLICNKLFYKTSISTRYYGATALIMIGMIFLIDSTHMIFDYKGLVCGIASAFLYALYVIVSKKSRLNPLVSTCMVSLGSMITCLCAALIHGSFSVPLDLVVWKNSIAIGIICTALPMLFLLKALQYISSEKASLLSVLEPIFVLIFGFVLLDEILTIRQIIGVVFALLGAVLALLPGKKVRI